MRASFFSRDTRELLCLFARHKVKYLIVGGAAVIYHGHARLTADFDVFFEPSITNAKRVYRALEEFWSGDIPFLNRYEDLLKPNLILQFGVRPNRIDLINTISGVAFSEAWKGRIREYVEVEGTDYQIFIIGLTALIANKKALGRLRDLDDLRFLVSKLESEARGLVKNRKNET